MCRLVTGTSELGHQPQALNNVSDEKASTTTSVILKVMSEHHDPRWKLFGRGALAPDPQANPPRIK